MAAALRSTPLPFFSFAFFLCLLAILFLPSSAQTCSGYTFPGNRAYALCRSLPRLGASLHWTYHPSTATVDVAYRAPQRSNGWVAWGINPTGQHMVGTQALVAFPNSSSGGAMVVYTTPVTSYAPSMRPAALAFEVRGLSAERRGDVTAIFATLRLPNNGTQVDHVWQESGAFVGGFPGGHAMAGDNLMSFGSLNFLSGEASTTASRRNARPPP